MYEKVLNINYSVTSKKEKRKPTASITDTNQKKNMSNTTYLIKTYEPHPLKHSH